MIKCCQKWMPKLSTTKKKLTQNKKLICQNMNEQIENLKGKQDKYMRVKVTSGKEIILYTIEGLILMPKCIKVDKILNQRVS